MKKIILVGAGGHAKSVLEIIKKDKVFDVEYIFTLKKEKTNFTGIKKIQYSKLNLEKFFFKVKHAHISFGQITNRNNRENEFIKLKKIGYKFPKILSRDAIISSDTDIGNGTIIMKGCIINSGVKIGENCIINSGSIIEHDVQIGNNCHIAPGAILNGSVIIGKNSFIGSGSILKQSIKLKKNSFIQAGKFIS